MTHNTRTSGLGTPPPGWLPNCLTGARNAILQTFAGASGDPLKPDWIRREITALCEGRMIDPREPTSPNSNIHVQPVVVPILANWPTFVSMHINALLLGMTECKRYRVPFHINV